MMYGPDKATCIVHNREGQDALGDEWSILPKPVDVNKLVETSAPNSAIPDPVVSEEMQALLNRATAANIKPDRRWGIETLRLKVNEAEALARA